jgi:hypothetical protein
LALIIAIYFGADHLLSTHLKSTPQANPENEKALVQNMASFLENSPDLRKKISESGQTIAKTNESAPPAQHEVDLSSVAKYFGNTPADQYFKKFLIEKKKMNPDSTDEQTKIFIEMSDYIQMHPKESVESLENALQSIPQDMTAERNAITPAFIHSSINFIEELPGDDQTKKTYLKRFIDNTQDPEVKDALESHFPDLLNPTEAPPENH